MTIMVLRRKQGHAEIKCPFCEGKGTDPLEVMSALSNCPVCNGKCRLRVREPLQECAFCGSSGIHPYTRMTCTACLGKGVVTMPKPVKQCAECNGTGKNGHDRMPCARCKGIGVIPVSKSPERSKEKEKVDSGKPE